MIFVPAKSGTLRAADLLFDEAVMVETGSFHLSTSRGGHLKSYNCATLYHNLPRSGTA